MKCFNPLIARYSEKGWFNKDNPDKPKHLCDFTFVKNLSKDEFKKYVELLNKNCAVILPCGDCFACRSKQRLSWVIRNTFEAQKYEHNVFITLTYDDNVLCPTFLSKAHLQAFFKRLRINLVRAGYTEHIKYFACGEYGGLHGRPHYHAIIYNLELNDKVLLKQENGYKVYVSKIIEDSWKMGNTTCSDCTDESIKYTCGYVQKKLTKRFTQGESKKLKEWLEEHETHFVDNFILASNGIGMEYFENHHYDLYANDEFLFHSNGHTITTKSIPYFDYLMKKTDLEMFQDLKENRRGFFDYSSILNDSRTIKEILEAEEDSAFKKYNLRRLINEAK